MRQTLMILVLEHFIQILPRIFWSINEGGLRTTYGSSVDALNVWFKNINIFIFVPSLHTLFLVGADRKEGFWLIWEAYIKFNWCRDLISSHRGYKYMLDSYSDSVLITTQRSNDLIIISEVSSHFILYLKFISVIN